MFSNDGDRINNLHNSNMKKLKLKEQDCIKCNKSILTKSHDIKFLALIHGKKSDKEKKQKSKTSKQDDLQEVGDKKSSKSSSKKLKKSMPKKSMKNEIFGQQVPESSDNEVNNQNNFSVTSSKKQFKEDLEGKFDMIIEADEINEHESEGEPKGKNHDLQDDK